MLSSSAKSTGVSADELSSSTYELGLSHQTTPSNKVLNSFGLDLGRYNAGREAHSDYARLSYSRAIRPNQSTQLSLGTSYRHIRYASGLFDSAHQLELRGGYHKQLAKGDTLQAGLILCHTDSERGNTEQTSLTAYLTYDFAQKLGPAEISVTLGAKHTDYPRYNIGFLAVPNGRQDTLFFGSLDLRFDDLETIGFMPTATLQLNNSRSNISRFETKGASLALGFASSF